MHEVHTDAYLIAVHEVSYAPTIIGGERQTVRAGEMLSRPARSVRAKEDWLRLPVTGVRYEDWCVLLRLAFRAMNRNVIGAHFRDGTLGLRVCAAPPGK